MGPARSPGAGGTGGSESAVEVVRSSVIAAPREQVWARVVTAEGVSDEFRPLLAMRFPTSLEGASIADVPLGRPAGRAWILLGGVIPLEYDDLVITELEPPRHFQERPVRSCPDRSSVRWSARCSPTGTRGSPGRSRASATRECDTGV
jgi:hypothetical protein